MSDFWNKNKGSIKSGLLTVGKYGYQGTKYVAKTGYHLGKNQYNAHKGKVKTTTITLIPIQREMMQYLSTD